MDLLNLSKEDSLKLLDLRKDELNLLCLDKSDILNQPARVAVVLDYSGSMSDLYRSGYVQAVIEKLLPVAMKFDDNGEMELWIFSNGFRRLPNINLGNFYKYIEREVVGKLSMGSTAYAPVMKDVVQKYIFEDPDTLPNYILFITDGDNDYSDKEYATEEIVKSAVTPIFWQFIGISDDKRKTHFDYLEHLDEMEGRYVDNANFFALNDILYVSDQELYDRILTEYPKWLEYPEVKELIQNPNLAKEKYTSRIATHGRSNNSSSNNGKLKGFLKGALDVILDILD